MLTSASAKIKKNVDFIYTQLYNNVQINMVVIMRELKKWIEPIYREFYSVDINLKKYFLEDRVEGMSGASQATERLKTAINEHPGTKEQTAASQLQENKNKALTNDWSVDILNELLDK